MGHEQNEFFDVDDTVLVTVALVYQVVQVLR